MVVKMSDLKVDVPLAAAEDAELDESSACGPAIDFSDFQSATADRRILDSAGNLTENISHSSAVGVNGFDGENNIVSNGVTHLSTRDPVGNPLKKGLSTRSSPSSGEMDNFGEGETLAGSLEDLVSNFDQKITECFKNYTETTDKIAPVQVRTQEEIMSESHMLQECVENENNLDLSDDEELAQALDLHSLIVSSGMTTPHDSLPQTAEQVIEEIDEIMQGSSTSELTGSSDMTMESADSLCSPLKSPLPLLSAVAHDPELEAKVREAASLASNEEKLRSLAYNKLVALQGELESLIKAYNESLVQELALKDELEYEKELKNTFISLLLSIQNKRRQYVADKKRRGPKGGALPQGSNGLQPQYLTAVIPYEEGSGPPDNQNLQALIKLLRAVNEDNSNVPNMLTDYILNGENAGRMKLFVTSNELYDGTRCIPEYLTAVIPYEEGSGPPDNQNLQALIKLLRAVNEDNSNVPNMLTDYILNVLCPSPMSTSTESPMLC